MYSLIVRERETNHEPKRENAMIFDYQRPIKTDLFDFPGRTLRIGIKGLFRLTFDQLETTVSTGLIVKVPFSGKILKFGTDVE